MIIEILNSPNVLIAWLVLMLISLAIIIYDLWQNNKQLHLLMKVVWLLTVTYSGPVGLAIYYYSGRRQISKDSIYRKAFRSVSHCYSGCGAGEIAGVLIAAGLLSLGPWWVTGITFALAYVAGYALTVGPLVQDGVGLKTALADAFYSETASITVMEITAIGVDLLLAGKSSISHVLFWTSLVTSLTIGLFAAYPVNIWLIKKGVKKGMHNPKHAEG